MTNVIQWPPVGLTSWELVDFFPQSRSVGLIGGRARTSSTERPRRIAGATVRGIGPDQAGAGYMRQLSRLWAGTPHLTRVRCLPTLWVRARRGLDLSATELEWLDNNEGLLWTHDSEPLNWITAETSLTGVPFLDQGWNAVSVTGLPPAKIVARPSELITVYSDAGKESAYALTVARSDADGRAIIRTDKASAFGGSGPVSIGAAEVVTFEAVDIPRAQQGLHGDFEFSWSFREVFEDEYADGWTVLDPWG